MKHLSQTIGRRLVKGLLFGPLVVTILPLGAIAAAPPKPIGCPDGWIPRPPEVNPQLGPCMPGSLATPQQPDYQKQKKRKPVRIKRVRPASQLMLRRIGQ